MASRSSPDVRRASLLLSGLVLTGDDSLEAFRDRRVGDSALDVTHLKRARDVLDAVHEAITSGDDGHLSRLEEAWSLLCDGDDPAPAAKAPAEEPSAPEPPPMSSPAPPEVGAPPRPEPSPPPPPSRPSPGFPVAPPPGPAPAPVAKAPSPVAGSDGASPWAKRNDAGPAVSPPPPSPPAPAPAPAPPPAAPPPPPPAAPPPVAPAPAAAPPAAAPPAPPAVTPPASQHRPAPAVAEPPPVAGIDTSGVSNIKVELSDTTQPEQATGADRTVLPFAGTASPPPSAVADVESAIDALGQTRMVDDAPKAVTLPFKMPPGVKPPITEAPALPTHLSGLNLEHYAALCAERDVYKGWESQVEARYGITNDDDKNAVDAHFRAQLKANTSQMSEWRKHYARVEAWAREQRGN